MTRVLNNSLAAIAAVVVVLALLSAITSIPVQHGAAIAAPALA
jgi:hypothetical protein